MICVVLGGRSYLSDASEVFGFGLAVACVDPMLVQRMACEAGKRNTVFRLRGTPDGVAEKSPKGQEYRLPLAPHEFKTVLRIRARRRSIQGR